MNADELQQWALEEDEAFWATEAPFIRLPMHDFVLRYYSVGLKEALKAVSGGPSFLTKKNIKNLIAEADKALGKKGIGS